MFPKSIKGRINNNAECAFFTDNHLHFEVLKYFVWNSAPTQILAFKRSKFLSAQNWNHLLRWSDYCLDVLSVPEFITTFNEASDNW